MANSIQMFLFEDNPDDVIILTHLLRQHADTVYTIATAESLAQGIRYLDSHDVDIIVADLGLPDSQGIDTFLRIREIAPATPVVVLSGQEDRTLALKAVEMGAQDYVVKSDLEGDRLERVVRYAIERHRLQVELAETKIREMQQQVFNKLQLLSDISPLCIPSDYGAPGRLRDSAPQRYNQFVARFGELLELAVSDPTMRAVNDIATALDDFARDLQAVNASASDIHEMHKAVLAGKGANLNPVQLLPYTEDATNLLVAVLSRLLSLYRANIKPQAE
jgi:DNA-binding NarL/FixJ family response regulator